MNSKKPKSGLYRGKFFYFLGRNLFGKFLLKKAEFQGETYNIGNEPFLLFANHCYALDPAFEIMSLKKYIRYVVSDHVVKNKFIRAFLNFTASPIIKKREESSDVIYNQIISSIKAGVNVAVHIEGGMTNTGETGFISKRNAVLAKECGSRLITYRIYGGFLKNPRWAKEERNGPIFGGIVHEYSKEEIERMTVDELYDCICKDLYVNNYDEQRKNPFEYKTEKPAENVENMVYVCPKCKSICTLKSNIDTVSCHCGFSATIDKYGFWHSAYMPFDNLLEWDVFQKEVVKDFIDKIDDSTVIFHDENQSVYNGLTKELLCKNATITLYKQKLTLISDGFYITIPVSSIKRADAVSKSDIAIVTDTNYYMIKTLTPRSATKYNFAIRYLQGKETLRSIS